MRMNSTITNTNAANANVANATSFLQTQDGSLNVASSILTRVSELATMASDPTKNSGDVANYNAEFKQLQTQLTDLTKGTFNGVALFGTATGGVDQSLSVGISSDGSLVQNVTQGSLAAAVSSITSVQDIAATSTTSLVTALSQVMIRLSDRELPVTHPDAPSQPIH